MTDDADALSVELVQLFEGVHDNVQIVAAQCAESFIDKEGVDRLVVVG